MWNLHIPQVRLQINKLILDQPLKTIPLGIMKAIEAKARRGEWEKDKEISKILLFTDYLSGLKKRLLKSKLNNISKGKVKVDYKMKFPLKKF